MKKILLIANSFLLIANIHAQTEKFDIASFIPPQNWQRMDTSGTVGFITSKTTNGLTSFCQIVLFPSTVSKGNAKKDFRSAWDNIVAIPTKTTVKPVTESSKTNDGWNITKGVANITQQGLTYTSLVITVTGYGKTMSFLVNLVGDEYVKTVDQFFTDLHLDSKATITNKNGNMGVFTNQSNLNSVVTMNDYEFVTPEQWQVQKNMDHISIQNISSGCVIKIIAPQASSGDLEKDVNAVFDLMYTGWQYQKRGNHQYILKKGFLLKGLEYYMKEASMSMTDASGRYQLEEGAAIVVKAGNQIVILSVRHNSTLWAHDDCWKKYATWKRFFNSFTVKNAAVPKNTDQDISTRIIGLWKTAENMVISDYVFAANGKYQHGGAMGNTSTSSDFNYEYIHYKSYSWEGDGSYSINGSQLTLKKRGDNNPKPVQIRFEKINHGGTGWKDRMYIISRGEFGENESGYEKDHG